MRIASSPRRIIALALSLFFLGSCTLLFSWPKETGSFPYDMSYEPDYDMSYVPDYPDAQEVQVWTEPDRDKWFGKGPYKRVTFVTSDTPQQVFTFYKDKLRSRGLTEDWRVDSFPTKQSSDSLRIIGFGRQEISPPMFVFSVTAEERAGAVHVTVERSAVPGM